MGVVIKGTVLKHGGKLYLAFPEPLGKCKGCCFVSNHPDLGCSRPVSAGFDCLYSQIFPDSSAIFKCLSDDYEEK